MTNLDNATFYVVVTRATRNRIGMPIAGALPEGIVIFDREEILPTIDCLWADDEVEHVFQCDPDIPRKDITADIAAEWLKLADDSVDGVPARRGVPSFVDEHWTEAWEIVAAMRRERNAA